MATQNLTTGTDGIATVIAVSPAVLTGESTVTFTPVTPATTSAQWGAAAAVTVPGFPAGVAVAATAITTKGSAGSNMIVIVGERATVSRKFSIRADGAKTGFDISSKMVLSVRFPGESAHTTGSARPTTSVAGDFSWQRRTVKKTYVFFTNEAGDVKSNRAIIPAN